MNKGLPAPNKYLSKKWRQQDHELHMKKLKEMKPSLNLNPPAPLTHLKSKAKKDQQLEGNRML